MWKGSVKLEAIILFIIIRYQFRLIQQILPFMTNRFREESTMEDEHDEVDGNRRESNHPHHHQHFFEKYEQMPNFAQTSPTFAQPSPIFAQLSPKLRQPSANL